MRVSQTDPPTMAVMVDDLRLELFRAGDDDRRDLIVEQVRDGVLYICAVHGGRDGRTPSAPADSRALAMVDVPRHATCVHQGNIWKAPWPT